ncbi:RHS repeat-associated core domain-containing protein [Actinomadura monticuli]|uniref:RHS repeat-associated core domain-containing protein n=1 Tax=Actinomadura monticuli TaxID=3097367 RepID=UPI003566AD80
MANPDDLTYNLRARQYDPATGRFVSRDPLNRPYTSSYAYAADSPTVLDDPTGQAPQVPGGPGGAYKPGNTRTHDFALRMAYDQMVQFWGYGAHNTYADLPGRYGWRGSRWRVDSPAPRARPTAGPTWSCAAPRPRRAPRGTRSGT